MSGCCGQIRPRPVVQKDTRKLFGDLFEYSVPILEPVTAGAPLYTLIARHLHEGDSICPWPVDSGAEHRLRAYEPTITIIHAVANNRDDPAGAKEIALKDKISASCDGKSVCIYKGPELVPNETFLIEVTYTCRDPSGSARQKGPIHLNGTQEIRLSCKD